MANSLLMLVFASSLNAMKHEEPAQIENADENPAAGLLDSSIKPEGVSHA